MQIEHQGQQSSTDKDDNMSRDIGYTDGILQYVLPYTPQL